MNVFIHEFNDEERTHRVALAIGPGPNARVIGGPWQELRLPAIFHDENRTYIAVSSESDVDLVPGIYEITMVKNAGVSTKIGD